MARCVKTPTKGSSNRQLSPLKAAQDRTSPIKQPPRRRLGGAGCFRRCAPPRTEGLHDDLDGTPLRVPSPPKTIPSSDPPKLADAIAAYNKLMDAEESLVEVVGLDGLRRHRRRRDVVEDPDRACDKPCWGLDDDLDDYPPACAAERPIA